MCLVSASGLGRFGRAGTDPNFGNDFDDAFCFSAASGFLFLSCSSSSNQLTGLRFLTTVRAVSPALLQAANVPKTTATVTKRKQPSSDNIFRKTAELCTDILNILCSRKNTSRLYISAWPTASLLARGRILNQHILRLNSH